MSETELPFPRELEPHDSYVARFVNHPMVKSKYPLLKRHSLAEAWWNKAKHTSTVSIISARDGEVLIFD